MPPWRRQIEQLQLVRLRGLRGTWIFTVPQWHEPVSMALPSLCGLTAELSGKGKLACHVRTQMGDSLPLSAWSELLASIRFARLERIV